MPHCTKRGSDLPFLRINKDSSDPEGELKAKFAADDISAILQALVTVSDKAECKELVPGTLAPAKESKTKRKPPRSSGVKRTASEASLDSPGRDGRARTGPPPESAGDVAEQLVAMHPDHTGCDYGSGNGIGFRDVVFGMTNAAGTSREVVKILEEFTRIRLKADHKDQKWPRIEAGDFASDRGRCGDGTTITMRSLAQNEREHPAANFYNCVSNADPLPGCRDLLAPEDVVIFTRLKTSLRYVNYLKTSWKWLVQLASYVVPKLKAQVYDMIQVGYEGITKEDFDGVWDRKKHPEIYDFAFKRYLADIVRAINSTIRRVEQTAGGPGGEATAGGSSKPQEPVTTIGHVGPSTLKHLDRQRTIHKRASTVVPRQDIRKRL